MTTSAPPNVSLNNTLLRSLVPRIVVASLTVTPELSIKWNRQSWKALFAVQSRRLSTTGLIGASGSAKAESTTGGLLVLERPLAARFSDWRKLL